MRLSLKNMKTVYIYTYITSIHFSIYNNIIEKRNVIQKKHKDIENVYYTHKHSLQSKRSSSKYPDTKLYRCTYEDCNKHFHDKCSFRKHQLTHGEKQFLCKNCGKKFLDKSKLKRHSLVHSGVKQYKCNICQKMFSLDFNLRTHQRIHTGEKPYACMHPGCFKRFSQSSNLSAHERTHDNMNYTVDCNGCYVHHKQLFTFNPLQSVIDNSYSSSLNIKNLIAINKLYDVLKKGIELHNQQVNNDTHKANEIDYDIKRCVNDTVNGKVQFNKGKMFVTTKGKQIFDIKKGFEENNAVKGNRNCSTMLYNGMCYNNMNNEGYNGDIINYGVGSYYVSSQMKKEDYIDNENHYDGNGYMYNPDGIEEYKEYDYFPYSMTEFDNFK